MGKGNRNSQKHAAEIVKNSEKLAAQKKKAEQKKNNDKAISIALAAVAVVIVAVFVISLVASAGVFIRAEKAMTTENFTVDSAMMNFFYNNYLANWYSSYGSYISAGYFALDPTSSLKLQQYGKGYEIYFLGEYDGTWYDYFLDSVIAEVESYLTYAEGAIAAGLTLTDDDKAEIDELMASVKESLKASKASYSDWYGKGVKAGDVRRAYELVYLADNFIEYKQEQLENALDDDLATVEKYVEDNKASFYTADVYKYTITTNSKDFESEEAFDTEVARLVAEANKIAAATSAEELAELIKAYQIAEKESAGETVNASERVDALDISEYKTTVSYTESDDLGKWLFTEKAEANATKVIEATTDKTETIKGETKEDGTKTEDQQIAYKQHTVSVYFVIEPMHIDKDLTKNAGYFISDDKALVEEFYNEVKGDEMSAEEFREAAEKFYNDVHADHDHDDEDAVEPVIMFDGIEQIADGYFSDTYKAINEFIDADDRENNTFSEIVEIKVDDTTTYYAIMYFVEYAEETWYVVAYNSVVNEQFNDWTAAQKEATPVTVDNKAVSGSITTISWSVGSDDHEGHDHE